jgi:hypothetical protein
MDFYERIIKDVDDIYASKLYKNIINYITKNDNDGINEFIDLLCLKFEYSNEIIKLILEDKKLFLNIIQRYHEINKKNINNMIEPIILKSNTEQKIKYNKYNKVILSYEPVDELVFISLSLFMSTRVSVFIPYVELFIVSNTFINSK